ncbi:MAG: PAS domain S-box protein [Gammaproteobacteria bacterium]|nr:PAS domain S-box protein [Gammaproteobacteria bacterium]
MSIDVDVETLASQGLSREILLNLLNLASDAIILLNDDGRIFSFNRGAETVFGHSESDLIGKSVNVLIPQSFHQAHQQYLHTFKQADIESRAMNSRRPVNGVRKNGEVFHLDAAISKIRLADQWVFMVIMRDISESEQILAELQHYKLHLEDLVEQRTVELCNLNQELEAFSYSVSHDLRAPLRSIDGFSQALLEDYSDSFDELATDYLWRLRRASQHMGELIDNLLILSRVTRYDLSFTTVNLSQLCQKIIPEIVQLDPSRRVNWLIPDNISCWCDEKLCEILLMNLLSNAWKYSAREAQAEIEFGVKMIDQETVFFIKDNGVGFDMAYVDKLFVAFQRLHGGDEFKGTGVGLATVYRIITRHHGRIWAEASVDQGACFYFTLLKG